MLLWLLNEKPDLFLNKMNMYVRGFFTVLAAASLLAPAIFGQSKEQVAITIDDLPTLSHGTIDSAEQRAYFRRILVSLKKHKVRAVGFTVGRSVNPGNRELLAEFLRAGHSLGNHTFSHPDLNKVTPEEFIEDIEQCQKVLLTNDIAPEYFRYPMLHRGVEEAKRDAVASFLINRALTVAPITIDSDEVEYNIRFVRAYYEGNKAEAEEIGKAYVQYMIECCLHFKALAFDLLDRRVRHILLLHMNFINSFYLDELLTRMRELGWEFISLKEALRDPLYEMPDRYRGRRGVSYLERISNIGMEQ